MTLSPYIKTGRLRLRPLTSDDGPAVIAHLGQLDVARMLTSVPHPYPPSLFPDWLAGLHERAGETWGVEADGVLVGCASLTRHAHPAEGLSLGYWYAPQVWGRGYATEVGATLRDAAFAETGVAWLFARRIEDNPASGRVLEKIGFVETGTMRHFSEARKEAVTSVTYELTRRWWLIESAADVPTLQTQRLVLRPLMPEDDARIAELVDDLEVSRWLALVPHPYRIEDARTFLAHSARLTRRGNSLNLAVAQDDGTLVGLVGVRDLGGVPEIGWWLGRPFWGRGLMSEAVEAVLDHVFARGVELVVAGAFEQNLPSLRIQQKMGFKITGGGKKHCLALGQDLPHLATMLARRDFAARSRHATGSQ